MERWEAAMSGRGTRRRENPEIPRESARAPHTMISECAAWSRRGHELWSYSASTLWTASGRVANYASEGQGFKSSWARHDSGQGVHEPNIPAQWLSPGGSAALAGCRCRSRTEGAACSQPSLVAQLGAWPPPTPAPRCHCKSSPSRCTHTGPLRKPLPRRAGAAAHRGEQQQGVDHRVHPRHPSGRENNQSQEDHLSITAAPRLVTGYLSPCLPPLVRDARLAAG